MIWGFLIAETFLIAVLIIGVIWFAAQLRQTSTNASATLIAFDQRASAERADHRIQIQGLVDRLMSQDWESVRLHEGAAHTPDGGFLSPADQAAELEEVFPRPHDDDEDEEPTVEMRRRGGWGHVNAMQDRADLMDEGERLALEDDVDGFEDDRERRLRQARERGVVK